MLDTIENVMRFDSVIQVEFMYNQKLKREVYNLMLFGIVRCD